MAAKGKPSILATAIFGHVRVWTRLLVAAIAIGALPAVVHATTLATPFVAENSPLGLGRNPAPAHAQAESLQAPELPLESVFGYGQIVVDNAYATRGAQLGAKAASSFGARTLGAAEIRILQTGGNKIASGTANALNEATGMNLARREWGRALEALKAEHGLPPGFHGSITSAGGYLDEAGKLIDSLLGYVP
jgi:stage V sporulation protein SpoVS